MQHLAISKTCGPSSVLCLERIHILSAKNGDPSLACASDQRFIQTALREWAYAQAYPSSTRRAQELPVWLHRYNWHRPHSSLKSKPPISRLALDRDNLLRLHS